MKILGIDTSTMMGAVGIIDDEELVAELRTNIAATHSERLMLHVDGLLKSARLTLNDVDGLAVTTGPGSFTGLRIGLAAAKAMAYATGKPVAGIPTLDALADNLPFCRYQVAAVMDARKKMVYAAIYRQAGMRKESIMPATVMTPDELIEMITEPTVFLGEGAYVYRGLLEGRLGEKALLAPKAYGYPSGAAVAFRGLKEINAGRVSDPMGLVPLYIRKSEAEEKAGAK